MFIVHLVISLELKHELLTFLNEDVLVDVANSNKLLTGEQIY